MGCAAIGEALGEPLAGSAPEEPRWLVLEVPGAWGHKALHESDLHPEIASDLLERCDARDIRIQLVRRRVGRSAPRPVVAQLASFGVAGDERFLEEVELRAHDALADLDLDAFAAGRPTGQGRLLEDRRWLVCTHGTKDPCCAARGRPLHRALAAVAPDRVWHSAHLGGDRFAANAAVLPDGLLFGRVPAARAAALRTAVEDEGRLPLELARGRAGHPRAAQAAEHAVRLGLALDGLDDVAPLSTKDEGPDAVVRLAARGSDPLELRLRHEPAGALRPTSCKAAEDTDPGTWRVVGQRPVRDAA